MTREEYRVEMQEKAGRRRKAFTLVNAESAEEAMRVARQHHGTTDEIKSARKNTRKP